MGMFSGHRPGGPVMAWKVGAVLLVIALVVASGCFVTSKPAADTAPQDTPREKESDFATGRGTAQPVAFDGKRAMGYLEAVCKIGPRISGTDGMKKQQGLIEKHFKDLGAKVEYQKFSARQVSQRQP